MPPFEIDEASIRRLAALLEETGLGEIEYAEGERRIRVTGRGGTAILPAPVPTHTAPSRPETPEEAPEDSDKEAEGAVVAPMVGTVYLSPEPGSPPFVQIGDTVDAGDTLVLIEAMKTFNPVRSPRAGRVVRVLVSDAAPVEYGEALIILE